MTTPLPRPLLTNSQPPIFKSSTYSNKLHIISFNARSLLPKLDNLLTLIHLHSPDIVCICETWLHPDISYSELSILGYTLFRKDRNRHGGGVTIYALSPLNPTISASFPSHSLELIPITINLNKLTFHIACFYRPPSSITDIETLSNLFYSLGPSFTSILIIAGDLNVNTLAPPSALHNQLSSLMSILSLKQLVTEATHHSHAGSPSIIDLILAPQVLKSHTSVLPPISSSDHNTILSIISLSSIHRASSKPPSKTVRQYHLADFDSINESILATDWDSLLSTNLDDSWSSFTSTFFSIVHQFTPTKTIPLIPLPPWFPRPLMHKIHKHRRLPKSLSLQFTIRLAAISFHSQSNHL